MRKGTRLFLTLLAVVLGALTAVVQAADESVTVLVRFYPTPGREEELQGRLVKLRDFIHKTTPGVTYKVHRSKGEPVVLLVYEIFPSEAAADDLAKTVFPAFQKVNGPIPEGIVRRPVEREVFRALTD